MDEITQKIAKLVAAYQYAIKQHDGAKQTREDLSTPYWVHPFRVVERLRVVGITDYEVLSAAVLHDAIEDTETSLTLIEDLFGKRVGQLVFDVSQGPNQSLDDYHAQIKNSSSDSQSVKLADKWDNVNELRSMKYATYGGQPPLDYIQDAKTTLVSCPDGNSQLQEYLQQEIELAEDEFKNLQQSA